MRGAKFSNEPDKIHPLSLRIAMPIRLEIASRILVGLAVPAIAGSHNCNDVHETTMKVEMALKLTDALLAAHNASIRAE